MFVRLLILCGLMLQCPAVLAGTNSPPQVSSPSIFRAVGQPNASYDVLNGYSDPEEDGIGSIVINGVTGAASAGVNGTTVTITPNNVNTAALYTVFFTVCDDGVPSECDSATITVVYNDPPVLSAVTANASSGDTLGIPFSEFFLSMGVINGNNSSDGDIDGIASTTVSNNVSGPYEDLAVLSGSSVCSVSGTDTSDLTFTASHPDTGIDETCYIRVCEELPPATLAVCSLTTVTITVQPQTVLKDGFEDIE